MAKEKKTVWQTVDTQTMLDELAECLSGGHDQETIEFYAKRGDESYFPTDISRDGHSRLNLHVLVDSGLPGEPHYLELVFVGYEYVGDGFLDSLSLRGGKIDGLKRFQTGGKLVTPGREGKIQSTGISCARLLYRWIDLPGAGPYFRTSNSIAD